MDNKKRLQDLNNRKMERLEQLKIESEMNDYFNTYEHELELELDNNELLKNVINDILKF